MKITTQLSICLLLALSIPALAIDTDGDGVDDSIDAFPNDPGGATDTDSDGMPNEIIGGFIIDDFETGDFSANNYTIIDNWVISSSIPYEGQYWARMASSAPNELTFLKTFSAGGTLILISKFPPACCGNFYVLEQLENGWYMYHWKTFDAGENTFTLKMYCGDSCMSGVDKIMYTELFEDTDDDNDGILDENDTYPLIPLDTDLDGIPDTYDWDDDNDGTPDSVDVEPLNDANSNEVNLPLNSDFIGTKTNNSEESVP